MSYERKKLCTNLEYVEHFLPLVSAVTVFISILAFYRNYEFYEFLKICVMTTGITKYKSITKKKKKKHDKIALLVKFKENSIGIFTFKALINSNISHNGLFL